MKKFRPFTIPEYERWIEHRCELNRATSRGRAEPLSLLVYGCIIPAIYMFRNNASEIAIQVMLWMWSLLTVVACLVLSFAETKAERARRYARWLAKYDDDLKHDAEDDEREAPTRRAAYEEALAKYRMENPEFRG